MPEINKNDIFAPDLNEPLKELQGTLEDVLGTLGHLRQSGKSMESTFKSTTEVTKKTNEETKKLSEGIKDLEIAENKLNESKKKNAKTQEKELNALQLLKKELKEAQSAMLKAGDAGGTMSKEYQTAAKKAGELADKIGDAKDEAKVFANDTAFGALGTRIGLLKDKVLALDFKGVGEQLKAIGKLILANPLLLLAGVIAGIVVALYKFKDSIPFVGAALDKIGQGVDYVVGKLKEFTDWLGLSTFAADEKAQKLIEAANDEIKAISERYDHEIKLASAAGKEVIGLEIEKQKAIRDTAYAQVLALNAKKKLTEEEEKQLAEFVKITSDSVKSIEVLKEQAHQAELKRRKEFIDRIYKEAAAMTNLKVANEEKRIKDEEIHQAELKRMAEHAAKVSEFSEFEMQIAKAIGELEEEKTEDFLSMEELRTKRAKEEIDTLNSVAGALGTVSNLLKKNTAAQKLAATSQAILNTYLGATLALTDKTIPNTFARIIAVASVIASGLSSVAKINNVKGFFRGTKSSPEGFAMVGERGAELMNVPGEGLMLSPNNSALTYLKKGTEIIPHEKSMAMLAGSGVDVGKSNGFMMLNHLQLVNDSVKQIGNQIVGAVDRSSSRLITQGTEIYELKRMSDTKRRLIKSKSFSS